MSTHHPTTAALLAALRHDYNTGGLGSESIAAHRQWGAAGCPDAPEPRFVPTSPGWYWRKGGGTGTYIACVTFDPNGLQNCLAWTSGFLRIDVTDDGLWLGPVAPWSEPAKAVAARAWYGEAPATGPGHSQPGDAKVRAMAVNSDGSIPHPDPGPCPPKPRTAEEARREPMPGDRWRSATENRYYTVAARGAGHRYVWDSGVPGNGNVGDPGETYLGHFPLETP